ncbi:uncharacterized protein LOC143864063 [Tasmannia lanceolata]|uniref:uncharacterized protein LOC143864063 n=1 Tax=Tasmannia lanceolata TaxID=3420 RepID=UPI00406413F7
MRSFLLGRSRIRERMKNVKVREPSSSSNAAEDESSPDELRRLVLAPSKNRKVLSKQLSMRETSRDAAWEKQRRHQILRKHSKSTGLRSLTDEDLHELKGSIELGFGFNEEDGQRLCRTLPALDLYFAVNRQLSDSKLRFSPSPVSTPILGGASTATSGGASFSSSSSSSFVDQLDSPNSPHQTESWKICCPGDNPQHVKTRLKHWAQAVACSVRLSC